METKEIENILYNILLQNGEDIPSLDELHGKSLVEDLGLDSVSIMQIVAEIEKRFGISLDEHDSFLELLDNFDSFVEFLVLESEAVHG